MRSTIIVCIIGILLSACEKGGQIRSGPLLNISGFDQKLFKELTVKIVKNPQQYDWDRVITIGLNQRIDVQQMTKASAGKKPEILCTLSGVVNQKDMADISQLIAQTNLIDYKPSNEIACEDIIDDTYDVSFSLTDGRTNRFSSMTGTCPFSDDVAKLLKAIDTAGEALGKCIDSRTEENRDESKLLDELSIGFSGALYPGASSMSAMINSEKLLSIAVTNTDVVGATCSDSATIPDELFTKITGLLSTASIATYKAPVDRKECEPLIGSTAQTLSYKGKDGVTNTFATLCKLEQKIQAIFDEIRNDVDSTFSTSECIKGGQKGTTEAGDGFSARSAY